MYYSFDLEKLLDLNQEVRDYKKSLKKGRFFHSILEKVPLLMEGPICLKLNPQEGLKKEDWIE